MRLAVVAAISLASCGSPPGIPVQPADARKLFDGTERVDAPGMVAATDVPSVPCTATATQVYAAFAQPTAALGTILACAPDGVLGVPTVSVAVGTGVEVTSAVAQFRIAYQTRDGQGGPAVSTARVYLPATPRARPLPIVVAIHGSVGLADGCAPSASMDASLPLPYAARGFAVIAPDLAGLGNAGTQAYLDNRAQGWQVLDGARALHAILPPGVTAPQVILAGYSQGGGAALSAHSLIASDGPGIGTLVATVVFAPQWPISLQSFDYEAMLRTPTSLTISEGLAFSSVAVMREYAFFDNHVAAGQGASALPAQFRTNLEGAIQSQCLVALGGVIQTSMLHAGDLIDASLRTSLLACLDNQPGCSGDGAAYAQFLLANVLPPDPASGPVLLVQGLLDQIMPPAKEGSCIRDKLVAAGVGVETCVVATATHGDLMEHHAEPLAWAESVLAGGARTPCTPSAALPACAR